MDQSLKPNRPFTPASDGAMVLCDPRPTNKRITLHVTTPSLDHQAKKTKMDKQDQGGANSSTRGDNSPSQRLQLDNSAFGNTRGSQNLEKTETSTLLPQQDLYAQLTRYEQEQTDLRAQLDDVKAKTHDLEAQVTAKDKQLQKLKDLIAFQSLQPTAMAIKSEAVTIQGPDDSAVTDKFTALRFAIANLTLAHLNGHPFSKPTKVDHKELFARLTQTEEDYKDYLGASSGFKAFFFEGVIWTKLIDELLSRPMSAFLDVPEGLIRDRAYNNGGASPQKFHAWRAYTADFLQDVLGPRLPWGPHGKMRSLLVGEFVELLSRYSTLGASNVAALTQELDNVVDKAVNLAWLMAKSRAYWVCSFPICPRTKSPYGFIYNKDHIQVKEHLEGGRRGMVDLVGRPGLFKHGDSDGKQYDTHVVVKKAVALVYEGKKPKAADLDYVDC
ncbi:hypothetical protein N0V93_005432 [Gnomoniopsis smithogilvyi]|uniref:Uncharacterized protein n=1 Tax=Gnomoniopsis smithogilvyi TaxID=1191159 RepID=A0A9W8YWK5_9PEZI|nr:hypothetical protein N0V93_005432 [Gnomoniopsis smithogilvyi]